MTTYAEQLAAWEDACATVRNQRADAAALITDYFGQDWPAPIPRPREEWLAERYPLPPKPEPEPPTEDGIGEWIQALGLLSTLAPTMVVDTSDPIGMARQIEAAVRAARGPTIEEVVAKIPTYDSGFFVPSPEDEHANDMCKIGTIQYPIHRGILLAALKTAGAT